MIDNDRHVITCKCIVLVLFLGVGLYYVIKQHVMLDKELQELTEDLKEKYVSIIEIVEIMILIIFP